MLDCKCQNIVGFESCFVEDKNLWIVMEYCSAGSIADLLKLSKKVLTEDQIVVCVRDVLKALAYLHSNNRIHRDIKCM